MNTEGPFDSENSFIALASTIGHSVLLETLKMAAFYVQHSNGTFKSRIWGQWQGNEAKSCYLFVQGTGLQILINRFGMAYDAESLKRNFNYCLRHS